MQHHRLTLSISYSSAGRFLSSAALFLSAACFMFSPACSKQAGNRQMARTVSTGAHTALAVPAAAPVTVENFESGTKTAYAAANVTLSTGVWNFSDALLGNLSTDRRDGAQSARVRNSGTLTMEFDLAGGASSVTIRHAVFGSDGSSTWQLWYSTNGGSSFVQAGSTVTSSSTTLQTASFTLTVTGNVRFQVRKTDGTANRVNFDDFTVTGAGDGGGGGTGSGKKFLFDATKAETAGNADWVIDEDNSTPQRIPTPAQSTVTASTAETYWTGALSSWGIALVKAGDTVETLPSGAAITYGNASNPQDLSHYAVFVVDEPNILFTAGEKTAILNFVSSGGGLFMISDHNGSDRNNDGHDSPNIWNDLMTNNSMTTNPFGFSIDLTNISETSTNIWTGASTNPILNGSQGAVSSLQFNNGATVTTNPSANAAVQGLIWQGGFSQSTTHIMCASSTFGSGRVFVVTDSSPMDDGTGAPNNTLFVSWSIPSHTALFMNASLWLAKLQ
ncbi:MAG: hydrolase [Bacteroidota bacterium]|nr:hydrolase [Bacteroidota bacterium]MDP4215452.1 hydrolase [Bacteroidota bacterium]MDP4244841.1 hydrolase [Bacteroidota bacterium]MDP4255657.1 hydrolase [Bacteroidota bacterium]MDP4257504.1 hydrolase [Bacteroidota bacterium]